MKPLSAANIDWTDRNIVLDSLSANLLGNASTVTNGVYTNGTYADPSWITSLADTKITGTVSNAWPTANKAIYVPFLVPTECRITKMFCVNGLQNLKNKSLWRILKGMLLALVYAEAGLVVSV